MGTPYPNTTASGYNASPPADDGSVTASNKVKWATIKGQIGDPVKGEADAINTALRAALNVTPTTQSTAYTTTTADHLRPIEVTGTTTISLGDSATMVASSMGYQVPIINRGSSVVTVALITATDTLDGTTNGTVKLAPGNGAIFTVNSTSNGYETIARAKPYIHGADIASAATVNLDAATGDYVHITGTTTITALTLQDGDEKTVEFTGALTLTNGASLVLPGAANITTAAGDTAIFRGEAAGLVRCILYQAASTAPLGTPQSANTIFAGPTSGAAASPSFKNAATVGSSLVLLGSKTASASASISFAHTGGTADVTFDWTAYDEYEFHFVQIVPATNLVNFNAQISEDSGATYKSAAGTYSLVNSRLDGTPQIIAETLASTAWTLNYNAAMSNSTNYGLSGVLRMYKPSAAIQKSMDFHGHGNLNGVVTSFRGVFWYTGDAGAWTGIKFLMGSGNIASGTIYAYGIRKS